MVAARRVGADVVVSVRDTGKGLTQAEIQQLFRPFVPVHELSETRSSGTGLGLSISKQISDRLGGRIWCESGGRDQGATFSFSLPLWFPPASREPKGPAALASVPSDAGGAR